VRLTSLVARSDLNGKNGTVVSFDEASGRHAVLLPEEATVCVKTANLLVLAPVLPDASVEWKRENNAESLVLLLYHKELEEFVSQHGLEFAEWWRDIGTARAAVLASVCPDLPQTLQLEENLLPDWNIETMASDNGCVCPPPCEHGYAMRLLHDLWLHVQHPGPQRLANLLSFDFAVVRNLQGCGSIQSPRKYGPHGTVCNSDGTKCERLTKPSVSQELAALCGALDRGTIVWAHVRAAAIRRRCVADMILVGICDEFRRAILHDDGANTNSRLLHQVFRTPVDMAHKIDIRVLDVFLRPRDCFNAPFHPLSHVVIVPEDQRAIVETLPAMMHRLYKSTGADSGRLKRDPVSRDINRFMRSGEGGGDLCAACGKTQGEAESRRLLQCKRCKMVQYCSRSCQVKHWRSEHKAKCTSKAEDSKGPREALVVGELPTTVNGDTACRLSPCDSLGAFDLIVVWGDAEGRKSIVHLAMRIGHGVERSTTIGGSGSRLSGGTHRGRVLPRRRHGWSVSFQGVASGISLACNWSYQPRRVGEKKQPPRSCRHRLPQVRVIVIALCSRFPAPNANGRAREVACGACFRLKNHPSSTHRIRYRKRFCCHKPVDEPAV